MTVKKKLLCGFATLTILIALSSCSGCSGSRGNEGGNGNTILPGEAPVNPQVEVLDNIADESILATIDGIRNDMIIVTETRTGRRYDLKYGQAELQEKIKGTLSVGAHFSILPDKSMENVIIAVNVDELSGRWFYDMDQHRGLAFEKKGGLSSINSGSRSYREWKLKNGRLYIYFVTEDMVAPDRHEFLVEEASIKDLDKDHLVFELGGQIFDCRRQTQAVQFQNN